MASRRPTVPAHVPTTQDRPPPTLFEALPAAMSGTHLSREFFDLVKAIGEAKSKQVRGAAGYRGPREAVAKRRCSGPIRPAPR